MVTLREIQQRLQATSTDLDSFIGGEPTTEPRQQLSELEFFKIIRNYRIEEQHLLNHRITWNLTIQGFLFTAYGVCLGKLIEATSKSGEGMAADVILHNHSITLLRVLFWLIPVIGLSVSIAIGLAMIGAKLVLDKLKSHWDLDAGKTCRTDPPLPHPAAAGSELGRRFSLYPPMYVTLLFAIAWLGLLLYNICQLLWGR